MADMRGVCSAQDINCTGEALGDAVDGADVMRADVCHAKKAFWRPGFQPPPSGTSNHPSVIWQCGGSKCEIFQEQEKAKAGTKGTCALRARLGIRYSTKKYEITAREGLQVTVCCPH